MYLKAQNSQVSQASPPPGYSLGIREAVGVESEQRDAEDF